MITEKDVPDALRTVQDSGLGEDLVGLNMIQDLRIEGERVSFTLVFTTPVDPLIMETQERRQDAVPQVSGVREASINLGAQCRHDIESDAAIGQSCPDREESRMR